MLPRGRLRQNAPRRANGLTSMEGAGVSVIYVAWLACEMALLTGLVYASVTGWHAAFEACFALGLWGALLGALALAAVARDQGEG